MNLAIALLLVPSPAQEWSAHALPSVCEPPATAHGAEMLRRGTHIALKPEPQVISPSADAFIAPSLLTQLITSEFGRSNLTLIPGSNPLLINADDETTGLLRTVLSDLDRAGEALNIQIEAVLSPDLRGPQAEENNRRERRWIESCRSGDTLNLGTRIELPFVGGFSPEVATEAATADPLSSSALTGETLHLTCSRVRNGAAVHIEGLLDIAYHTGTETFDPDTPDLGMVQQPQIEFIQVAFSGVASPGAPVIVAIKGASSPIGDRTLSITATTSADIDTRTSGWNIRDLSFINSQGHDLETAQPGLWTERLPEHQHDTGLTPVTPGSLSGLLTKASSLNSEQRRVQATAQLLLIPASNREGVNRADRLTGALESELLRTHTLTLTHDGLSVTATTTQGRALRIIHGSERPYLVGYMSEIATNSWAPTPRSEVAFEGICINGSLRGDELHTDWWSAETRDIQTVEEDFAHSGAMQQLTRAFTSGAAHIKVGEEASTTLQSSQMKLSFE